jgi:autotransporter adhesin
MDKIDKLAWNAAIANDMTASTSTKERNTCRRAFGLLAASVMLGLNANAVLAHDTAAIEASFVTCAAEDERADGHCASYNADSIATTNAATTTRSADNGNITATADYYFASNGQNDGTDNASATGANATAIGANAMAQGDGSVVIGEGAQDGTEAVVDHAIVIGTNAKVDHESNIAATGTIAIGNAAYAYNDAAVALGQQAEAIGIFTTALGSAASATGTGAIAVGHQAVATGINAMAIGVHAEATNVATTAIGGGATANALYAVAIGYEASADQFNSVALGTRSTADRANAVSIGRTLSERQLIHVAAGTHGTDAVNVSQLTPTLDALGATFNDDGSVSAPSYNVGGSTVHTVGDALSNLDGRVTINTTLKS